jgi:predicted O-methyltransferase YrrM
VRGHSGIRSLLGETAKQRAAAGLVVVLGVVVAALLALRQWPLGAAGASLILTALGLLALDGRRRTGDVQRRLAQQAESTRGLARAIESTKWDVGQISRELSALGEAFADGRSRHASLLRRSVGLATRHPQEVEALLQLYGKISPTAPMPPAGNWALNPTGVLNLYAIVERECPGLVVELGSGTSTVWLGYAVTRQGRGRVVSVDHLVSYAEQTRSAIDLHELGAVSEVRVAHLVETAVDGEIYQWYESEVLADLQQIDLLFVDGPPGDTGHDARYPAVPQLLDRLADGALVVLDDVDRDDEQEIVERWLKYAPALARETTVVGDQAVLRYRVSPPPAPTDHSPAH